MTDHPATLDLDGLEAKARAEGDAVTLALISRIRAALSSEAPR